MVNALALVGLAIVLSGCASAATVNTLRAEPRVSVVGWSETHDRELVLVLDIEDVQGAQDGLHSLELTMECGGGRELSSLIRHVDDIASLDMKYTHVGGGRWNIGETMRTSVVLIGSGTRELVWNGAVSGSASFRGRPKVVRGVLALSVLPFALVFDILTYPGQLYLESLIQPVMHLDSRVPYGTWDFLSLHYVRASDRKLW